MKRLSFIVCLFLGIVCFPLISSASQNPDAPPAMLDYISTEELENSWEELDQDYGDYMPYLQYEKLS